MLRDDAPTLPLTASPGTTVPVYPSQQSPRLDPPMFEAVAVQLKTPPSIPGSFSLSNYDFDGEYIGWPLERVCKESTVTPHLVYDCDNNSGGIGNIRNFILTCIRYAIEAGASGIIVPRIQRRSEDDLGSLFSSSFQPFDYFFDEEHFRTVLGKHCSQLTIYARWEDIPNAELRIDATEFLPKELIKGGITGDGCDDRGVNRHIDQFRVSHDVWLAKEHPRANDSVPITVRFKWAVFFEWDIYRDGSEFANTFGDILRIKPEIQTLAAITLDEVAKFVGGEEISEELGLYARDGGRDKKKAFDARYLGVHLRTEGDALGFWPDYDTQADGYMKAAMKHGGLKHAYIATGSVTEGQRFAQLAEEEIGMRVKAKTDLLTGANLERLNRLTWDQQALVDFLVLSKSSHFTGCSFSSFAMNIAFKRHTMTNGTYTRPWKSPADVYSTLIGRFESWFGDWMFMYECMWP